MHVEASDCDLLADIMMVYNIVSIYTYISNATHADWHSQV